MTHTQAIIHKILEVANPQKAQILSRFFKTNKGEYGEGDLFLGVTVPRIREIVKKHHTSATFNEIEELLANPYHEIRLCGLLILVQQFQNNKEEIVRENIYKFYLTHTNRINNWDLVDLSAKEIIGEYLWDKNRKPLYQLIESHSLWEQRIAIVATNAFIRKKDLNDTFSLAEKVIYHPHDLIRKATGWMLREAGKQDSKKLLQFLDRYACTMPRVTLRYAIEKMSLEERKYYMSMKKNNNNHS